MKIKTIVGLVATLGLLYSKSTAHNLAGPKSQDLSRVKLLALINSAATRHNINPKRYLQIITLESNLNQSAHNKLTHDFGLAQVNLYTAKAFKFDIKRLKTDSAYNLDAGALILQDLKQRYAKREPTLWVCRYNVGSGALVDSKLDRCLKYLAKLSKVKV